MSNLDASVRLLVTSKATFEYPGPTFWAEDYRFFKTCTRTRTGFSNPKYRSKILAGENATTPLSGVFDSIDPLNSGTFILHEYWVATGKLIQRIQSTGFRPGSVEFGSTATSATTADNLALKYLYKAIGERRSSFQGGIFLAELGESLRMITSPAKALREGLNSYFRDVRKYARGSKKAKRKVLADTWLEYSFGWAPLVSDIKQGVDAYVKHTERILTNRITRRGSEGSIEFLNIEQPGWNFSSVPTFVSRSCRRTVSVQYIVGLRFAGQGCSPDVKVFERAGLTLSQFVPTLWEVIPWSFLADYFTNIGDIINAGATNTSDVIWASKTVRSESVFTGTERPDDRSNYNDGGSARLITGVPSHFVSKRKVVTRSVPVLGLPSFQVSLPGNPIQWINMAALGASARKLSRSF